MTDRRAPLIIGEIHRVWFISYVWRHKGWKSWNVSEEITYQHPLFWLNKVRGEKATEEYQIIFYQEISDVIEELLCENKKLNLNIDEYLERKLREKIKKEEDI